MIRLRTVSLLLTASAAATLCVASGPGLAQIATSVQSQELLLDRQPGSPRKKGERPRPRRPGERTPPPPTFGSQPGSGAGTTGFVSTSPKPRARPPVGTPLAISPVGEPSPPASGEAPVRRRPRPPPPTANTTYVPRPAPLPAPQPPPSTATTSNVPRSVPSATVLPPPTLTPPIRRPAAPEEDPFAPTGIHAGAFFLRPAIELSGGYDTNPGRGSGGAGSWVSTVAPELVARSDWSRHEFVANLRGSYSLYDALPSLNRPTFDGRFLGRLDVTRNTRAEFEGRYLLGTDYPGSPDLTAGFSRLPIFHTVGATAGLAQRFNRFDVVVKGTADRVTYEQTELTNGKTFSNADRDYNQFGAIIRASYELSPAFKPFVETTVDTRIRDLTFDRYGLQRSSKGVIGRAGTTFEFSRALVGELSVGYLVRSYKDPSLPDLRGLLVDGSLVWAASGLTTVKLSATTQAGESTVPGASGVFRRDVGLQADHAFRRWLIGTLRFGYGQDTYDGDGRVDRRFLASTAITYKLWRELWLRAEVRREWMRSNVPGVNYTADMALIGVRLQR